MSSVQRPHVRPSIPLYLSPSFGTLVTLRVSVFPYARHLSADSSKTDFVWEHRVTRWASGYKLSLSVRPAAHQSAHSSLGSPWFGRRASVERRRERRSKTDIVARCDPNSPQVLD